MTLSFEEKRAAIRYRASGKARVGPMAEGNLAGAVVNISLEGCLLRMEEDCVLAPDSQVEVSFSSSYLGFRTMCWVRSSDAKRRLIGFAFLKPGERAVRDLEELIEYLEGRLDVAIGRE